jgi:hypothetical protein
LILAGNDKIYIHVLATIFMSTLLPGIFLPFWIVLLLSLFSVFIFCYLSTRNLPNRFHYILSKGVNIAELLEKYSRIVRPISIKVNAKLKVPILAKDDMIYVNREHVYEPDMYVTVLALVELERSGSSKTTFLKRLYYFFLIIAIIIGSVLGILYNYWILGGVDIIILLLLLSSFLSYKRRAEGYEEIGYVTTDLLELGPEETAIASMLLRKLALKEMLFAPSLLMSMIRFFLPL